MYKVASLNQKWVISGKFRKALKWLQILNKGLWHNLLTASLIYSAKTLILIVTFGSWIEFSLRQDPNDYLGHLHQCFLNFKVPD